MTAIRICRGCGCTDDRACPGGCSWVLMDFIYANRGTKVIPVATGVCSVCAAEADYEWGPMSGMICEAAAQELERLDQAIAAEKKSSLGGLILGQDAVDLAEISELGL